MKLRTYSLLACLLACSLLLSSCQVVGWDISSTTNDFDGITYEAKDCSYGGLIKSIEAVDEYTVRFTLCNPDPAFLAKIAYPVFAIQDQDTLNAAGGSSAKLSEEVNGTGIYRILEYVPGDHITLVPNPNYWGVPSKTEKITFQWTQDAFRRESVLIFNRTDGIDRPVLSDASSLQEVEGLSYYFRPSLNIAYLGMSNTVSPFSRDVVRKAFSMAIDRQQLVNLTFPTGATVAEQFLSSAFDPGFTPGLRWNEYDPEQAKLLLEQAEFDFSKTIDLSYADQETEYLPNPGLVAQNIRTQLLLIGVKIRLNRMNTVDFNYSISQGNLGLYLYGWSALYPDATNFFEPVMGRKSKLFGDAYSDIAFVIDGAAKSADDKVRQQNYNRVNELIQVHIPAIPLAHNNSAVVFNNTVQNVIVGPLNENFPELSTRNNELIFTQSMEPSSLWPGDETDHDTFRITSLLYDTLVKYEYGGTKIKSGLAEYWTSNEDQSVWNFTLRYNVKYTNGALLDANDVVATFAALWDGQNVNHVGRTGKFEIFQSFFDGFINPPAP